MTGMDVLRRCRSFEKDMERLELRRSCARDALTRLSRSMDMPIFCNGTDKMGEIIVKVDEIEHEIEALKVRYACDIALAAQLVERIDPMQGMALHMYMVRGLTIRQIAAEIHVSENSVRGLLRRGRVALAKMEV